MKTIHFIAHFEHESVEGGPLGSPDSGWTSLPDEPIKSLEYVMPHGASLILRDYEEYLHMVEVHQKIGGPAVIENVYLMGKKREGVVSYRITISQEKTDSKYKAGDVSVRIFPAGKEYQGGPTQGWRKGAVT